MDIINIFKTELWTQISNFLILLVFSGIVVSLFLEFVKNSAKNIFKLENNIVFWVLNILFGILFSIGFYFLFIFKNSNILEAIIYPALLSLCVISFSFLAYIFIIKWLFLAFETIINIFKGFKIQSENKIKVIQKEGLQLDSIAEEIKKITDITNNK